MSGWTEERDKTAMAMRKAGGTFTEIGKVLGITRNAAQGRYYRLTGLPSVRKPREHARRALKTTRSQRTYESLAPSKAPFASDDSCPDFAWDDDHCAAVLSLGPYPVMPRRAA